MCSCSIGIRSSSQHHADFAPPQLEVAQISVGEIPDSLRGRARTTVVGRKTGVAEPTPHVAEQIFNIFDTIGSGFVHVSRLDGPHICSRETTKKSLTDGKTMKLEKTCRRYQNARKCLDTRTDSKGMKETVRIEECCEGYETRDIFKYGCPIESTALTMGEVLSSINSTLWLVAESSDSSKDLDSNNITVIIGTHEEDEPEDPKSHVLNRIVPGNYQTYDWKDEDVLETVGGGRFVVTQSEDAFGSIVTPSCSDAAYQATADYRLHTLQRTFLNCLPLNSSYRVQNGVLHQVSGDLKPAAESLLSVLTNDSRFSAFASLLSDELRLKLSSNESLTVFVPSAKALASLSESLQKDIKQATGCFVGSHIAEGSFCSHDLFDRHLKSLSGSDIESRSQTISNERVIRVGRARVMTGDIFTKNGVIHVIDDVLFNDELLSWREHIEVYNRNMMHALEEVVGNTSEPITILVPPAGNETVSSDFARNHVVVGDIVEEFKKPTAVTTEANSTIFAGYYRKTSPIWMRISMQPRQRQRGQIGCSRITQDSVKGCHAILHFIEKSLPSVVDNFDAFFAKRTDLSKFYRLWRESSLNGSLTDEKPLTAFIPSDDSFSNNEFKKLLSTPKLADVFVRRYIVEEPLCSFDLRGNPSEIRIQTYANMNGEGLRPTQMDGDIFVDGARVEESEIVLTNGVVYVLESTIVRNYVSTQPGENRRKTISLLNILP
ncbi:unnamed protein product [Heligmosomoides polygyrus]|uniref:FAS1 domain-containing protein n=1 Tax=Heligmosomoides polygyrus TaxID=6339 RepID=A0A183F3F4_HELPZ|nr:unnamed protein product [Heligmosomoides polygyrus]